LNPIKLHLFMKGENEIALAAVNVNRLDA
jgi:hypothetical protein